VGEAPWFQESLWYRQAPRWFRRRIDRSTHYTYLRIARLAKEIGTALDAVRPPFRVYKFVAWGTGKEGKQRRYDLVVRLHATIGHWPTDAVMYRAEREGMASSAGPQ
jgi:hypothetical protein